MSNSNGIRPLAEVMAEAEKDYLTRALRAAGGKRQVCADALGISRKSLWQKLKVYGINELSAGAASAEAPEPPKEGERLLSVVAVETAIALVGDAGDRIVVSYGRMGDAFAFMVDELGLVIAHAPESGGAKPSSLYLPDEVLPELIEASQKSIELAAKSRAEHMQVRDGAKP